jgi:nucleotide-binding universal stress UspA family protein
MDFQSILVPVDFSKPSIRAVELALPIATRFGARLTLLHVTTTQTGLMNDAVMYSIAPSVRDITERIERDARENLERIRQTIVPHGIDSVAVLREGFPPAAILEQVRASSHDLVVMGTHGHSGIERVLFGSVTDRVLRQATVPVLVTR